MKKVLQKVIIFSIVFIIVFNISFPVIGHAAVDVSQQFDDSGIETTWQDVGGTLLDGIVGILSWIPRSILAAVGIVSQTIITQICGISGDGAVLTAEDIIFTGSSRNNQVNIIDVNFFDFSPTGAAQQSLVGNFREGVAKWYYALRNISIVISLAVLIYIGIRMAISSMASDKAKYKEMLKDWLVGFAVLFFLHYFMILILNLNNQLVDLIYLVNSSSSSTIFQDYTTSLILNTFNISFVKGWGSLLLYIILLGTTLALFIMYMKRLFTIGFLIVISPLITVTYSIDKLGDGKSQALGTWMKEFVYNVLIQPFHCIIYMVFVSAAVTTLDATPSLANLVFAVLSVLFIFKAEDIVKKIFGFEQASSIGGMMAAGAIAATGINKLASSGQKAKKGVEKASGSSKSSTIKRKQVPTSNTNTNTNTTSTNNTSSNSTQNGKYSLGEKLKNSKLGQSALGRAAGDMYNEKVNGLRELKADPAGTLKRGAKQLAIKQLAATAKLAPKLYAGGMIAGVTGDGANGIITGYAVQGGRFTRKISSSLDKKADNLKLDGKASRDLASAYENYKLANKDLTDEELYNKSADLLEGDIDNLTDKNEIALAKQLQDMRDKYELAGEKDPKAKVMSKLEDIQMGKVSNNIVNVSLDSIKNASKKAKDMNPSADIGAVSEDIMRNIEEAKRNGRDYLSTDAYKKDIQDKEIKKLAREIYKSNKVISAIGENSDAVIHEEIKKAIEESIK